MLRIASRAAVKSLLLLWVILSIIDYYSLCSYENCLIAFANILGWSFIFVLSFSLSKYAYYITFFVFSLIAGLAVYHGLYLDSSIARYYYIIHLSCLFGTAFLFFRSIRGSLSYRNYAVYILYRTFLLSLVGHNFLLLLGVAELTSLAITFLWFVISLRELFSRQVGHVRR